MTDTRSLDGRLEQDTARATSSTRIDRRVDVESSSAYRDEIKRLREENERLRTGLREIRQLLEPPVHPRPAGPPKLFPAIGLL